MGSRLIYIIMHPSGCQFNLRQKYFSCFYFMKQSFMNSIGNLNNVKIKTRTLKQRITTLYNSVCNIMILYI